jgi:hypothetical protein
MRGLAAGMSLLVLAGCTAFPRSAEQARVDIRSIVDSIECELAAVATSTDPEVRSRDIVRWAAGTDLDLTLVRSIGADGNVKVSAPVGLAVVSATPKGGITDTDTRINHIKFANSFSRAVQRFSGTCFGLDPSETGMGLANWFAGSVKAVDKDSLIGISFTKQFEIVASASARFGYTLVPVTNPVTADAGFGGAADYTNRFTIALTPPPPPPPPSKPVRVVVTNWPKPASPPPPFVFPDQKKGEEGFMKQQSVPPTADGEGTPKVEQRTRQRPPRRIQPVEQLTPRQRVLQDPELNLMLQRKSPVVLSPESPR